MVSANTLVVDAPTKGAWDAEIHKLFGRPAASYDYAARHVILQGENSRAIGEQNGEQN
jgi:hypothetical protein